MSEPPGPAGKAKARGEGGSITGATWRYGSERLEGGEWVKRPAGTKGFESGMKSLRVAEAPCALAIGRRGRIVAGEILSSWTLLSVSSPVECSILGVHGLNHFLVRVAGLGHDPVHFVQASGFTAGCLDGLLDRPLDGWCGEAHVCDPAGWAVS